MLDNAAGPMPAAPPLHVADGAAQERAKYTEIWTTVPEYRNHSPGLENVDRFMAVMQPRPGASLIDLGCGPGGAGIEFHRRGLDVDWLDLTAAARPPEIPADRFIEAPLWSQWARPGGWDYGFCCDVLEHVPTEYAMLSCARIVEACRLSWLQISLVPDEMGKHIGEPLHLTVRPFGWWLVRLATLGDVVDARDLCGAALFVVARR